MANSPEGSVEIRQIEDGTRIGIKNRFNETHEVTIDRVWEVILLGKVIGHIRYVMITHEQRTPGRRYVNARWQSPGWEYKTDEYRRWWRGYTKRESIERVVRENESRLREEQQA